MTGPDDGRKPGADVAQDAPVGGGYRSQLWRLVRNPGVAIGGTVVLAFILLGFLMPLPYDPIEPDTGSILLPPSGAHWMGTDQNGSDVFSRVVAAARTDAPIALVGGILAAVVGVPLGLMASARTRFAGMVMRGLDIFQSFPLLVLAIVIVALSGNDRRFVVVAIMLVAAPQFIRLVRAEALTVREQRYIEAARAIGSNPLRVTFRHVLPNVLSTIFAQLSLAVGTGVLAVAALSFIGVGVVPPDPSWGAMIRDGSRTIATGDWWLSVFPGCAILVFVVSFNAIAEGIESTLQRR